MVVINVAVTNCQPQTIVIGRRGTYDTMQIAFDLSNLIDAYGNGVAVLAVKRSQDESAYPAVTTQADNTLTWTVIETDTAYVGAGECQLMWYVDGGLAKTIIYPMVVMRDILATSEEAPDAYQTWVDDLTALGAETLQNAQNAEQSASDAESAKDDAVTAKEAAESAQEAAETAVTHYPKIENNYWMVWDVASKSYVSTGIQAEGEDGYSPEISITTITGGHRVTITDKDHPQGQSFDVLDGQGGGGTSDYTDLTNKPQINGHTLTGNQTAEQLDLATPSDIPTDAGDIEYDESATYQAGSVGAELQERNRQLSDVEENQIPELKNAIDANEEAVADTQSMIATVEATTTASKNYAVGDLLVYDGKLYEVISAIATGATIIVGSNVTQTTVESQIASGGGGGGSEVYHKLRSITVPVDPTDASYNGVKYGTNAEGVFSILFDTDDNGESLNVKKGLIISVYSGASSVSFFTNGTEDVTAALQLSVNSVNSVNANDGWLIYAAGDKKLTACQFFVDVFNTGEYSVAKTTMIRSDNPSMGREAFDGFGYYTGYSATPAGPAAVKMLTSTAIERVLIRTSSHAIKAGTKIDVWGL